MIKINRIVERILGVQKVMKTIFYDNNLVTRKYLEEFFYISITGNGNEKLSDENQWRNVD